jgi:hypothetical protein
MRKGKSSKAGTNFIHLNNRKMGFCVCNRAGKGGYGQKRKLRREGSDAMNLSYMIL